MGVTRRIGTSEALGSVSQAQQMHTTFAQHMTHPSVHSRLVLQPCHAWHVQAERWWVSMPPCMHQDILHGLQRT